MEKPIPITPDLLDEIETTEVVSKNYSSLSSAMGMEKYKAFIFGENLKSGTKLHEELTENGFTNASYSIGTFQDRWSEEETSLFVSQEMEGNKFTYELEPKSEQSFLKKFDFYKIKHLYVIGKGGVTVDLVEDMGTLTRAYICPNEKFTISIATPSDRQILLPDLYKFSEFARNSFLNMPSNKKGSLSKFKENEVSFGLPTILHEIGHIKDHHWADRGVTPYTQAVLHILQKMGITRKELEERVMDGKLLPMRNFAQLIDKYGQPLLEVEKKASRWAIDWYKKKESEGAIFWHNKDQKFWHQLEVAMASYRMFLSLEN